MSFKRRRDQERNEDTLEETRGMDEAEAFIFSCPCCEGSMPITADQYRGLEEIDCVTVGCGFKKRVNVGAIVKGAGGK